MLFDRLIERAADLGRGRDEAFEVMLDDLMRITNADHAAALHEGGAGRKAFHGAQVVRDHHNRDAAFAQRRDVVVALFLEAAIADRKHFIHEQDFGLHEGSDREPEADVHAAGVGAHGLVDELLQAGEGDDTGEQRLDFATRHPDQQAVDDGVFAAADVGVEAGAQFKQCGEAAGSDNAPARWPGKAGHHAEQCALPAAISADDAEELAARDFEGHIADRPEGGMGLAVAQRPDRVDEGRFELAAPGRDHAVALGDVRERKGDVRATWCFESGRFHHTTSAKESSRRRKTTKPATRKAAVHPRQATIWSPGQCPDMMAPRQPSARTE